MRYIEPDYEEEELTLRIPPNQENAFIKYLTQIQPIENIITQDFLKNWKHRIMFTGKEKATGFIENPRTLQINSCQRMNLSIAESLGLESVVWDEVWDNKDIMVATQGQRGNLMNALITKKQEFKDTSEAKRRKWFQPPPKEKEERPFY